MRRLNEEGMAVYERVPRALMSWASSMREFLKYTGGDKKALGIVLTPRHITELFAMLANVAARAAKCWTSAQERAVS